MSKLTDTYLAEISLIIKTRKAGIKKLALIEEKVAEYNEAKIKTTRYWYIFWDSNRYFWNYESRDLLKKQVNSEMYKDRIFTNIEDASYTCSARNR